MSDQYVGEIRFFPYMRGAPEGWLVCDGSTPAISSYEALAALLGTTYGGDGSTTFGLPDMRGRVPIGVGPSNPLGAQVGQETVTLNTQQLPVHNHFIEANVTAGSTSNPSGAIYAASADTNYPFYFAPATPTNVAMNPTMVGAVGGGGPHDNCAPTMPIVVCIAWDGVWPPQNN